jgi:hypothetical protein
MAMRKPRTARQRLIECEGTPFAPPKATKPVVDVLDGRETNDAIDPSAWLDALQRTAGAVAVYFELAADHEWWLAYDPTPWVFDCLEGPYHMWSTYPTGGWDHQRKHAGVVRHNLADIYWEGDPPERCDIYRSRVVAIEDAPEFVRREVGHVE